MSTDWIDSGCMKDVYRHDTDRGLSGSAEYKRLLAAEDNLKMRQQPSVEVTGYWGERP